MILASDFNGDATQTVSRKGCILVTSGKDDIMELGPRWHQFTIKVDLNYFRENHYLKGKHVGWERIAKSLVDLLTAGTGHAFYFLGMLSVLDGVDMKIPIGSPPRLTDYRQTLPSSAFPGSIASVAALSEAFFSESGEPHQHAEHLLSAASFYRIAMENAKTSPCLSYSLLVSSLECLAMTQNAADADLYDEDTLELLDKIGGHPDFGEAPRNVLKGRMRQIRIRVSLAVGNCLNRASYDRLPLKGSKPRSLLAPSAERLPDIGEAIKAAYNLRSRYLHTGFDHTNWTAGYSNFKDVPTSVQNAPSLEELGALVQHCVSWSLYRIIHAATPETS